MGRRRDLGPLRPLARGRTGMISSTSAPIGSPPPPKMSVRPSWPGSDTPPRQSIVETGTKLGEMHDRSSLEHGHRAFKSFFCRFAIRNRPENAKSEAPSGRAIVHFAEFWPDFPERLQERAARDDPRRANAPQSPKQPCSARPRAPDRAEAPQAHKGQTRAEKPDAHGGLSAKRPTHRRCLPLQQAPAGAAHVKRAGFAHTCTDKERQGHKGS